MDTGKILEAAAHRLSGHRARAAAKAYAALTHDEQKICDQVVEAGYSALERGVYAYERSQEAK